MKYEIKLDESGFIIGIMEDEKGIEVPPEIASSDWLSVYQYKDGKFVFSQEKFNEITEFDNRQKRINEILDALVRTDYVQDDFINSLLSLTNPVTFITDLISLIVNTMKDYPSVIAERKALITELKTLIK